MCWLCYSILAETAHLIDASIHSNNFYGYLYTTGDSTETGLAAKNVVPINLPEGAQILGLTAEGMDKDPSKDFYMALYGYSAYLYVNSTPISSKLTLYSISTSVVADSYGRVSGFAPL